MNVVDRLDGTSAWQESYLWGNQVDQLLGRALLSANNFNLWPLEDRLGSIRDVINDAGTLKDSIAYDGFGNIQAGELDPTFRGWYAWTGRQLDVETDLQYNHARWYDGTTGRWISQDPLGFDAGDSNLYRYVRNDAPNTTDPPGLQPLNDPAADRIRKWYSDRKSWKSVFDGIKFTYFTTEEAGIIHRSVRAVKQAVDRALADLGNTAVTYGPAGARGVDRFDTLSKNEKNRLLRWFGLGSKVIDDGSMNQIIKVFQNVKKGIVSGSLAFYNLFEEQTFEARCRPVVGRSIELAPSFWDQSPRRQAGTLFHEFTHWYAWTDDYGYIKNDFDAKNPKNASCFERVAPPGIAAGAKVGVDDWTRPNLPIYREGTKWGIITVAPNDLTEDHLRSCADTYQGFMEDYYLEDLKR